MAKTWDKMSKAERKATGLSKKEYNAKNGFGVQGQKEVRKAGDAVAANPKAVQPTPPPSPKASNITTPSTVKANAATGQGRYENSGTHQHTSDTSSNNERQNPLENNFSDMDFGYKEELIAQHGSKAAAKASHKQDRKDAGTYVTERSQNYEVDNINDFDATLTGSGKKEGLNRLSVNELQKLNESGFSKQEIIDYAANSGAEKRGKAQALLDDWTNSLTPDPTPEPGPGPGPGPENPYNPPPAVGTRPGPGPENPYNPPPTGGGPPQLPGNPWVSPDPGKPTTPPGNPFDPQPNPTPAPAPGPAPTPEPSPTPGPGPTPYPVPPTKPTPIASPNDPEKPNEPFKPLPHIDFTNPNVPEDEQSPWHPALRDGDKGRKTWDVMNAYNDWASNAFGGIGWSNYQGAPASEQAMNASTKFDSPEETASFVNHHTNINNYNQWEMEQNRPSRANIGINKVDDIMGDRLSALDQRIQRRSQISRDRATIGASHLFGDMWGRKPSNWESSLGNQPDPYDPNLQGIRDDAEDSIDNILD